MSGNQKKNQKNFHISESEEEILKFWRENKIFEKSLAKKSSKGDFVFFDGPPFATGLPHYGHILASIIKDAMLRYKTMGGWRAPRRWGWDCHGLPIENLIEKELKLETKKDIEKFSLEKFNRAARESVFRYAAEWEKIIPRVGRWVDMENDYRTMDADYTESVWWVFKTLYDKGLIYEGYKSMHICPRCETTLANFEVAQGYKDITDLAITVKFELEEEPGTYILAWTTTPWTLPGNAALAVNPEIPYVKVKTVPSIERYSEGMPPPTTHKNEYYILSKEILNKYKTIRNWYKFGVYTLEIIDEIKGKDLIGKKYKPFFDYYVNDEKLENRENGWRIYPADFVVTDEGTGIVHIAPAFGEDDMELGEKEKLPFIQHVGMDGYFKKEVKDFAGRPVKPKDNPQATDIEILKWLAKQNKIFSKEKITHSYPHCWRCETPLLNYAASSWFVKVTAIKDKLLKINRKINWIPDHLRDGRFGKWLEGARDWAISRSRFWGAPIPVWKCEKCEEIKVVGSVDEIRGVMNGLNKLFLVRHGEAENNAAGILNSDLRSNYYHLTVKGRKQVKKSAGALKKEKIDVIFSSPFLRTKETAEIIAKELGQKIIFDERIKEFEIGKFNGKKMKEFDAVFPDWPNTPEDKRLKFGIETEKEVKDRLDNFLGAINKKYKNKNIVIVSHGDITQFLYSITRDKDRVKTYNFWYPEKGSVKAVYSKPIDLHRPYIDEIKLDCVCGGKIKRIPEVFDCWFESGAMPYGQAHYPFENKKEFEKNFPAEFIAEGLDQTRGWFYTLLVLSTGLLNKPAYKNVVVNGIILAKDGQKMSKHLKNYPDPMEVVEKYGADALRFYFLSSPAVRGESLNFSEKEVDEIYKKTILRLWNVYKFYEMYAGSLKAKSSKLKIINVLDKWIIARLNQLIFKVSEAMDNYELDKATRPIGDFVEDLSTWYIRRSRERFKVEEKDKKNATKTTKFVLAGFSKVIAPFAPFMAEKIYQNLGNKNSVHLEAWPKVEKKAIDKKLLEAMAGTRKICSFGLEARQKARIKVRQPLAELRIKSASWRIELKNKKELLELIKDEVNVKEIIFSAESGSASGGDINMEVELDTKITPELKNEGIVRELIRNIQDLRKKVGLIPQQKIELTIETSEDFVKNFSDEIKRGVNASAAKFAKNNGEKIKIDELMFKIKIKK